MIKRQVPGTASILIRIVGLVVIFTVAKTPPSAEASGCNPTCGDVLVGDGCYDAASCDVLNGLSCNDEIQDAGCRSCSYTYSCAPSEACDPGWSDLWCVRNPN